RRVLFRSGAQAFADLDEVNEVASFTRPPGSLTRLAIRSAAADDRSRHGRRRSSVVTHVRVAGVHVVWRWQRSVYRSCDNELQSVDIDATSLIQAFLATAPSNPQVQWSMVQWPRPESRGTMDRASTRRPHVTTRDSRPVRAGCPPHPPCSTSHRGAAARS